MNIKETFESVNDFSQAKNEGKPYEKIYPFYGKIIVWIDSIQSEMLELAVADNLVDQLDAIVDAMYYTADFAACIGVKYSGLDNLDDQPKKENPTLLSEAQIETLRSSILTTSLLGVELAVEADEIGKVASDVFHFLAFECIQLTGINPLEFFEIVHTANMRKINPETRTAYVYKANGNIGKPEGFVGPEKEIQAKAEALGLCVI